MAPTRHHCVEAVFLALLIQPLVIIMVVANPTALKSETDLQVQNVNRSGDPLQDKTRRVNERIHEVENLKHEEHQDFKAADRTMSFAFFVTLLLFCVLVIFLNTSFSAQARMFAYRTVSYTISIFCAVLLQSVCFGRLLNVLPENLKDNRPGWSLMYRLTRAVTWQCLFLVSQRAIYRWSRLQDNVDLDVVSTYLKASLFLAHVCSFAWIGLWGEISYEAMKLAYQIEMEYIMAFVLVLAVFVYAAATLIFLRFLRWTWLLAFDPGDRQGQGVTKEQQTHDSQVKQLTVNMNIEGNIESICLASSFIVCQGLRLLTLMLLNSETDKGKWDCLARIYNEEGEEGGWKFKHNGNEVALLYCLALGLWVSSVLFTWGRHLWNEVICSGHLTDAHFHEPDFWHLVDDFLKTFLGMVAMWCFYYATNWSMGWAIDHNSKFAIFLFRECVALRFFVNAALVTVASLLMSILVAHASKYAEEIFTSRLKKLAVVVPQCSTVIGVAVGISWEKSFNTSALALLSKTEHKTLWQVILGIVVLLFLLPIWVFSILPMSEERGYLYGFVPRIALMKAEARNKYADGMEPKNENVLKHLKSLQAAFSQLEDDHGEQQDEQREPQRQLQQDPVDDHYRPLHDQ